MVEPTPHRVFHLVKPGMRNSLVVLLDRLSSRRASQAQGKRPSWLLTPQTGMNAAVGQVHTLTLSFSLQLRIQNTTVYTKLKTTKCITTIVPSLHTPPRPKNSSSGKRTQTLDDYWLERIPTAGGTNQTAVSAGFKSKDIDAVESQRLERIQAARRIKRVKSTQSRRSYSADSRNEDGGGGSSCLPTCLRGQRRSDKDRLYRSRQESSCSDFPSPDSNPPSYDGACRGRPRCNSGIEENAALLVDVTSSSHRLDRYFTLGNIIRSLLLLLLLVLDEDSCSLSYEPALRERNSVEYTHGSLRYLGTRTYCSHPWINN
ncbi:hypothetical protein PoB_001382400 [Plakobranchus ocellatus]|uniref:Uncharacterized protein n=1 Tax=Plakobranchus ocellatus TaxID=259542 RepID=A0AAV3YYX1_9GAST|nr:hypothetical protein PoB_001382400 [Plakobranchus ocellatus]